MTPTERAELEPLLPWHAAGTLSPADAARVEAALAADPELARQFALVREEMSETIRVNEALGAPSHRALDQLMAAIDADTRRYPRAAAGAGLARLLARLSPRTLAWAAALAALVIVIESGVLTALLVGTREARYETAAVPMAALAGSYVLVRFSAAASAAEISQFLEANKASIVDGPKPGDLYRLRIAANGKDEFTRIVQAMQGSKLVSFAGPE